MKDQRDSLGDEPSLQLRVANLREAFGARVQTLQTAQTDDRPIRSSMRSSKLQKELTLCHDFLDTAVCYFQ